MANKRADAAAAKAKKQKIILVVGGVLLLAVAAIQGPKLLKSGSPAPAAAPAASVGAAPAPVAASATPSAGSSVAVVRVSGPSATAVLAGVTIPAGGAHEVDAGQLVRFNLFDAKDPFVPQASDELSGTTVPTAEPTLSDTQPTTVTPTAPAKGPGTAAPAAAKPTGPQVAATNATILLNGKAQFVAVGDKFPKADPLFVVTSIKSTVARIGVAGGAFKGSKTVPLPKGKNVTLVNDKTGTRHVLKLVYTGAVPEHTESFTQAGK